MNPNENKRRFIRMDLEDLPAVLTRQNGVILTVLCKNLSGMGMLIESDSALNMDEEIHARITTDKSELSVVATVARIEAREDSKYMYGLVIKDIQ